jgi:hypothetical protein
MSESCDPWFLQQYGPFNAAGWLLVGVNLDSSFIQYLEAGFWGLEEALNLIGSLLTGPCGLEWNLAIVGACLLMVV